jgi:hypothetical protein
MRQLTLAQLHISKCGVTIKMAWDKVDTNTLTIANDIISLTGFTPVKFNQLLMQCFPDGVGIIEPRFTLSNGAGTGHASRMSRDGLADTTATSRQDWVTSITQAADTNFNVGYMCNIGGEEKLSYIFAVVNNGAGAGVAPRRREIASKYVVGVNPQITDIENYDSDVTQLKGIGSNFTLLGTD